MKGRDKKGRFIKDCEEGFNFHLPSLKQMLYWIFVTLILFPWIAIGSKMNILEKFSMLLEYLMSKKEDSDSQKKMDYSISFTS